MITIIVFIIWYGSKVKKSNFLPCQTKTKEQPIGYIATVQLQHIRQKDTVILYYYSMFCVICGGVVYILGHAAGSQERHISSIHTLVTFSEFGNEFDKTPILRHFTHSNSTKNHRYPTKNTINTLKNKASLELNRKHHI